jgi:hypothetical protein
MARQIANVSVQRFFANASRQIAALCFVIVSGASVEACVPTLNQDTRGLSAQRFAEIQDICLNTMKLSRNDSRFDDCIDSLAETARQLDKPRSPK